MKKLISGILASALLFSSGIYFTSQNTTAEASITIAPIIEAEKMNYIVGTKAGSIGIKEEVEKLGGRVVENWEFINSLVAELTSDQARQLKTVAGVIFVKEDIPVVPTATRNTQVPNAKLIANAYNSAVAADKVWSKGITGEGVTVAVVDSGILDEGIFSDFRGRIVEQAKFADVNNMSDWYGHGTHVSGIIGGDGSQSGGKYVGVAPGINLVNVKISDDQGKTSERNLVNGLRWIYENHKKHNIKVVNISNQITSQQSYKESATNAAVELLWKAGIVVVVSAGNNGGTECSVCYAPANDPYVITVGAVDDNGTKDINDDFLKEWSASGITLDGHTKPEVVAPGAHIISYMPKGVLRDARLSNAIDKNYFMMGGTSMSAPVVSGIVAMMLQQNPTMTPDQVKWVIQNTTRGYKQQPIGTAGVVSADAAVFFNQSNIPASAVQTHELSPLLDPLTDETGSFANVSWANVSWANVSWANVSWANVSWANSFDY